MRLGECRIVFVKQINVGIFQTTNRKRLNFEEDSKIGIEDELSDPIIETVPGGENFLGQFATEVVTLTDLPERSETCVSFDLYLISSWIGSNLDIGPDIWGLNNIAVVLLP